MRTSRKTTVAEVMTTSVASVAPSTPSRTSPRRCTPQPSARCPSSTRTAACSASSPRQTWFLRSDAAIRSEVLEDVLAHAVVVEPGRVAVDVVDGVVTLTGALDTHGDAEVAVALVSRIEGVVAVVDELTWKVPDRPETIPVRDLLH